MSTRTALAAAMVTVALAALVGCTSDGDWDAAASGAVSTTTTEVPPRQWLFAIQADGDSAYDDRTGQLSMPATAVQAFTDRPHRDARITSPRAFAELWQATGSDSFAEDPPNAVLTYWDDTEVPRSVVCEITGDVGYSSGERRLTMGIRVLDPDGATLPATMARASLFVDDLAGSTCENSPDDELNIEYFNMVDFDEGFSVEVKYVASSDDYQVRLACPQRESPTVPPASFDVQIAVPGGTPVSCYSDDPIAIPADDVADQPYCSDGLGCTFEISALNTATEVFYSRTLTRVTLGSDNAVAPDLEPATLPICDPSLAGSGAATPSGSGGIVLPSS